MAKKFLLEIELENDAFARTPRMEIARILKDVRTEVLGQRPINGAWSMPIMDINGNKVGTAEVVEI